ncbi:hypothetical protein ACFPES_25995 [Paenibacillus sp. GCM10023248]|nr:MULTISPECIES: hypothetical protein [Bacillales]MDD9270513.1 hypothetical protein [Paenibacillus sp. MAHUQ-63]MDR6884122.1 hypothetical protein [Bacillus sp. 3255]
MRTENQVKAKLIQLRELQKVNDTEAIRIQIEMLEWVLNQPTESYHCK